MHVRNLAGRLWKSRSIGKRAMEDLKTERCAADRDVGVPAGRERVLQDVQDEGLRGHGHRPAGADPGLLHEQRQPHQQLAAICVPLESAGAAAGVPGKQDVPVHRLELALHVRGRPRQGRQGGVRHADDRLWARGGVPAGGGGGRPVLPDWAAVHPRGSGQAGDGEPPAGDEDAACDRGIGGEAVEAQGGPGPEGREGLDARRGAAAGDDLGDAPLVPPAAASERARP
mmetsp:Transcript_11994/g.30316  ORF Transcript_11994/g.30316 Transcript_11994/m.30316 type:complete len:228 (-) Transcript_11994:126-809(-)